MRAARAAKIKHAREYDYAYNAKAAYALLGCSAGQMRGAVFDERRNFEPVEADEWLSPYVDAEPESAAGVLAVAQRQLQYVRRECPDATGRMLTVARLDPDGVVARRAFRCWSAVSAARSRSAILWRIGLLDLPRSSALGVSRESARSDRESGEVGRVVAAPVRRGRSQRDGHVGSAERRVILRLRATASLGTRRPHQWASLSFAV